MVGSNMVVYTVSQKNVHLLFITLSQEKQTATVALQPYSMVGFFYLFSQSFSKPPMPIHNWLFSESPTFGGTQHYLQSDVKVLQFTR